VLYGYITLSGIRTIISNNIDLVHNNKNITIVAAVLTLGVSGAICDFGIVSFGTTALAMIVGILLNIILKDKSKEKSSGFMIMQDTTTGEIYTEDIK
jgi:uracil permease